MAKPFKSEFDLMAEAYGTISYDKQQLINEDKAGRRVIGYPPQLINEGALTAEDITKIDQDLSNGLGKAELEGIYGAEVVAAYIADGEAKGKFEGAMEDNERAEEQPGDDFFEALDDVLMITGTENAHAVVGGLEVKLGRKLSPLETEHAHNVIQDDELPEDAEFDANKSDLNNDDKLSKYEKRRGEAIASSIGAGGIEDGEHDEKAHKYTVIENDEEGSIQPMEYRQPEGDLIKTVKSDGIVKKCYQHPEGREWVVESDRPIDFNQEGSWTWDEDGEGHVEDAEDSQLSYADWLQQWSADAGTELNLNLDQPFVELLDEYRNHGGKDDGLSAAKQHRYLQSQYDDDQVSPGMKAQIDRIIKNNTDPNAGLRPEYSDEGGI